MAEITGRCLCGEVTVRAEVTQPVLRACHCDMCRQHTSGIFFSVDTVRGSAVFEGPVRRFQSSAWANRGFCGTCGSTLWYGQNENDVKHPAAGLFSDLGDMPLVLEFFADMCPSGYALAGDHRKLTTEETIALFAPSQGEAS